MIVVSVNQYERTDGIGYGPLPPESAPVDVRRRRLRRRGRPTVCRRHGVTVAAVGGLSGVRGEKGGESAQRLQIRFALFRGPVRQPLAATRTRDHGRILGYITMIIYYYYKLPYNIPYAFRNNNSARAARPRQSVTAVMVFYSTVYNVPSYYTTLYNSMMGTRLVPMCCVTFFFFFLLFANHPHAVTWPSMCSLPPRRCPLRCFKGLVKGLRAHNRAKNLCVLGVPIILDTYLCL